MLSNYRENYRSIHIRKRDSKTGSRLGGNPPVGIKPGLIFDCTQYFATLVIDEASGREISIFNSFEWDLFNDRSFLNNKYIIFPQERASFLQFVIHRESVRAERESAITSELSSKALFLGDEQPDSDGWLDSGIYTGSKMGGYPFYWQNKHSLRGQGKALLDEGFVHLFQFGWPTNDDFPVSGDWPYGEYVLNVFVDDPQKPKDIRYGWG